MKAVTLNTVQGIGDLFWVYQKVAPHFDVIDLNILCVDTGPIQTRAREFCTMLPKVRNVAYVKTKPQEYHAIASRRHEIAEVIRLAPGERAVPYAVNAPLEVGINLRAIDPGYAVLEQVDLRGVPIEAPAREDYLCVFVAGARTPHIWPIEKWPAVIRRLAQRMGTRRVELIGASWDKEHGDVLRRALGDLEVTSHVATKGLPDTIDVIRRARFFLGYQSGLSILADNYDTPQLMVYFSKLRAMFYTWAKPANVRTRFHAMTFADDPASTIDALSP